MEAKNSSGSDEEFHDCLSNVQYCAIASPQGKGVGEVFIDFKKARDKWKYLKGSRMKVFQDYHCAKQFAQTPVEDLGRAIVYNPSPKADVDASPFSSVPQSVLIQFRACIEKGDVATIRRFVDDNPLTLVTSSDTPTLLQIRLRYNALHVAAACGSAKAIDCILAYLNSSEFWRRIYPTVGDQEARERQQRVTDLYLNIPELGNLETPLHFASKFGHVECTRLLATHPLIQLEATNRAGETPLQVAGLRLPTGNRVKTGNTQHHHGDAQSTLSTSLSRIFDQHFVVLVDLATTSQAESSKISILAPVGLQKLQSILVRTFGRNFLGLKYPLPHYNWLLSSSSTTVTTTTSECYPSSAVDDTRILHIRAFAGPMLLGEALRFRAKWLQANSTEHWHVFAAIRLTDQEKGYERQGRYLARHFGYEWFEYWSFVDDFLDFSSEAGLSRFEEYLTAVNDEITNPLHFNIEQQPRSSPPRNPGVLGFPRDSLSSTPIVCQSRRPNPSQSTPISKVSRGPWLNYRVTNAASNMLNDSLEADSSCSTNNSNSENASDKTTNSSSPVHRVSLLSPIVGMFERLAFSSPLRWILSEGPCSSQPLLQSPGAAAVPPRIQSLIVNDISRTTYKRRHSAASDQHTKSNGDSKQKVINDQSYSEPITKKSSPSRSARPPKPGSELPALIGHIYRALPSGDLELETAVASIVACSDDSSRLLQTPVISNLPNAKRNIRVNKKPSLSPPLIPRLSAALHSLSRFDKTRLWKHQIEGLG